MKKYVSFEIKMLQNAIIRYHYQILKEVNIVQAEIIHYIISKKDLVYQKDIENFLHLRRSTVSGILKTMEKKGFIIREASVSDARSKKIIPTKKAIMLYNKGKENLKNLNKIITKDIDEESLNIFLDVIVKMQKNLKLDNK